jgi:hypothetical protein
MLLLCVTKKCTAGSATTIGRGVGQRVSASKTLTHTALGRRSALNHALLEKNVDESRTGWTSRRGMSATRCPSSFRTSCPLVSAFRSPGHLTSRKEAWMRESSTRVGREAVAVLWCSRRRQRLIARREVEHEVEIERSCWAFTRAAHYAGAELLWASDPYTAKM